MPTYKGNQAAQPRQSSSDSGNAFLDENKVDVTANLTTADVIVLGDVPAGVRLTDFEYRAADLDGGTTLTMNIGYRSVHPDQTVAAAPTYFAAASTAFQAAQAAWVGLVFNPITFQEPVQIVAVPAANATSLPANPSSIYTRFKGKVVGVT